MSGYLRDLLRRVVDARGLPHDGSCEAEGCSEWAIWCETCRRAWCWQHTCEHMKASGAT